MNHAYVGWENKAKQSQSRIEKQMTEDGGQITDGRMAKLNKLINRTCGRAKGRFGKGAP